MGFADKYKDRIGNLCAEHLVDKLYLFGSATNDNFTENSDVDLMVKFRPIDLPNYFINYISLKTKLKELFNREVDLLEEQTISNPYIKASIDASKQLIYG